MYCNIMETYIKFVQNNIIEYLKIMLELKFDRKIATELTKTYINSRYYGYDIDEETKNLSKATFNNLKLQYEKLVKKFPKKDDCALETFYLFKYICYIDGIKKDKTLEQIVEEISIRRVKKYDIQDKTDEEFKKTFLKRLISDDTRKKEFMKKFETDKFDIILKRNTNENKIFDVVMTHNLKFKEDFKEDAIERVFNTGIIAEDKLIVEYSLIAAHIAKDIIKGKFETKYIADYTISLLRKKRKNKQILNIIDNQIVLDRLVLKITYKQFIKHKYDIYDLMKRGYRFAVYVEKENNIDNSNLNMFKFILVAKEHPKQTKYSSKFKNVIITE